MKMKVLIKETSTVVTNNIVVKLNWKYYFNLKFVEINGMRALSVQKN